MIRKVPNMLAWVMYAKDLTAFLKVNRTDFNVFTAPLFSTNPNPRTEYIFFILNMFSGNELIIIADRSIHSFTLEQIEEINKTWNKFYEED